MKMPEGGTYSAEKSLMKLEGLEDAISRAGSISWRNFGRHIWFYLPSFIHHKSKLIRRPSGIFPSISITGVRCALNCRHCGGRLLRTMIPAQSPERLLEVCSKIKRRGGVGCLISGGCTIDGKVPIKPFIETISKVKERFGLTVVVHTGLIDLETAEMLKAAGVDAVLIDIIGSDETVKDVYRLNATTRDFERSLRALKESGIQFVPHVLVGLHYGELRGELEALRMISRYRPSALILIVFFPIKGTLMESVSPPPPNVVAKVLTEARFMMPDVPMALGCARPKGEHRNATDVLAVRAGINAIAFPSDAAIEEAERLGLEVSFSSLCCSQIFLDLASLG